MEYRRKGHIAVFILALLLSACSYDLDVGGVISTESSADERHEQSIAWNRENPPRQIQTLEDSYTIYFGGDSHVGGIQNLQSLMDASQANNALAMVIAGDVCTGKPEDYFRLDSVLDQSPGLNTCLLVGNHDLYFDGWSSFFHYFGSTTYTMEIAGTETTDLFIFLDTGGGTLGELQFEWLEELLQTKRDNYRYVVATTHLNFFRDRMTGSTNPLNEEVMAIADLFERYTVNLLIQGHSHDRYTEEFGHCTYITLDTMKDGIDHASYMILTVTPEGLSWEFLPF